MISKEKAFVIAVVLLTVVVVLSIIVSVMNKKIDVLEYENHQQEIEVAIKSSLLETKQSYINRLEGKVEDLYLSQYGTLMTASEIIEEDDRQEAIREDMSRRESDEVH